MSDDFVDALLAGFERAPSPYRARHDRRGWAARSTASPAGATAFGHRGARALTWIIGCSGDEPIDADRDWVRRTWEATAPFAAGGVYVNALDEGRPVRDAYADEVWERLVAVKRRYDPDGAFSGNGIGRSEPLARGVRGRLGAAAHAELGEHAADVVLGGLGRDHQPLGDLGVRQAGGDEAEHLALARRQLVALAAGRAAPARAEAAQQRGRLVGVAARAEALEGVARRARAGERQRRARAGLHARERQPRAALLEREAQRGEARRGLAELGLGGGGVTGRAAPRGPRAAQASAARSSRASSSACAAQALAQPAAAPGSPAASATAPRSPSSSSPPRGAVEQRARRARPRRAAGAARRAARAPTGSSSSPSSSCAASSVRPWRSRSPASTASGSARPPPRRAVRPARRSASSSTASARAQSPLRTSTPP